MNKKVLVLALVPILIGMSGALAFSAWTGSDTKNITATAGTFSFSEGGMVTNFETDGINNIYIFSGPNPATDSSSFTEVSSGLTLSTLSDTIVNNVETISYYVAVQNLTPGEWVELNFSLSNTGNVAFSATGSVLSHIGGSMGSASSFENGELLNTNTEGFIFASQNLPSSTIVSAGGTIYFNVYVGLDASSSLSYMGQSAILTIELTLAV
jgi:hypothetical protein